MIISILAELPPSQSTPPGRVPLHRPHRALEAQLRHDPRVAVVPDHHLGVKTLRQDPRGKRTQGSLNTWWKPGENWWKLENNWGKPEELGETPGKNSELIWYNIVAGSPGLELAQHPLKAPWAVRLFGRVLSGTHNQQRYALGNSRFLWTSPRSKLFSLTGAFAFLSHLGQVWQKRYHSSSSGVHIVSAQAALCWDRGYPNAERIPAAPIPHMFSNGPSKQGKERGCKHVARIPITMAAYSRKPIPSHNEPCFVFSVDPFPLGFHMNGSIFTIAPKGKNLESDSNYD